MDQSDPFQSRFGRQEAPAHPAMSGEGVDRPRLGIIHLLVWTACTGVLLGWTRLLQSVDALPAPEGATHVVYAVMRSIGNGASWTALLVWIARRRRGIPFPVHPGERYLVALGITTTLEASMGLFTVLSFLWDDTIGPWRLTQLMTYAVGNLAAAIVWLQARRSVRSRPWRFVFLLVSISYAIWALPFCCFSFGLFYAPPLIYSSALYGPLLLVAAMLLGIAAGDLRKGRRHPWTHWAGVFTGLWFGLANLLACVALMLEAVETSAF